MKNIFVSTIFILVSFSLSAQYSISARIIDENTKEAVDFAGVRLLNAKDTTYAGGAQTDLDGNFVISNVKVGDYILQISFLGYEEKRQKVSVKSADVTLPDIKMAQNALMLNEVVVEGTAVQMMVRGDTIEYNANAFKTEESSVVEDLLKKLPGVEVDKEGKITVNGEKITKIKVDGEKFFDGDIEMATKNLPADLIEKIQVLDQKISPSDFTGYEDSDTERIINLTLKPNKKKGTFGNVTAGAGADIDENFRYDGNAFLNFMQNKSQTAVTGGANNVNTARNSRGRGSWGVGNGITATQNLGVNNNTTLDKNKKIGGDATFNHSANDAESKTDKESYSKSSIFNESSESKAHSDNYNTNIRVEYEWNIDENRTLIVQPNVSYNRSTSDSRKDFHSERNDTITSSGFSDLRSTSDVFGGGLNATFTQKSAVKKGRSLQINWRGDLSDTETETFNESNKTNYKDNNIDTTIIVDQRSENLSRRYNTVLRFLFTEPLWNEKNFLETGVTLKYTRNTSDKAQYDKDEYDNYADLNKEYSNDFSNDFFSETAELNFKHKEEKYNFTLGVQGEPSQTRSRTDYGDGTSREASNDVLNFAPRGLFQYNFAKRKSLRFDYRGSTGQPSINQMQPVKNNSNLMNETVGNASLNPAFNHRFGLRYSSSEAERFSSFTANLNGNITKDALVTNNIFDETGKQYTQTVNSPKTPYNVTGNLMYNTPLPIKHFSINTRAATGYNTRYGYSKRNLTIIDVDELPLGDLSATQRFNATGQLSLTYSIDVVEVGLRSSAGYSDTRNNLNNNTNNQTWDWSETGNLTLHLPKKITFSTDLSYQNRTGYADFDRAELIWNANVNMTILKSKGVLSLKATDILQQRLNIQQTVGDNYIQYTETNALRSYFMLSFTYKINQFSGGATENTNARRPNSPERGDAGDAY